VARWRTASLIAAIVRRSASISRKCLTPEEATCECESMNPGTHGLTAGINLSSRHWPAAGCRRSDPARGKRPFAMGYSLRAAPETGRL